LVSKYDTNHYLKIYYIILGRRAKKAPEKA